MPPCWHACPLTQGALAGTSYDQCRIFSGVCCTVLPDLEKKVESRRISSKSAVQVSAPSSACPMKGSVCEVLAKWWAGSKPLRARTSGETQHSKGTARLGANAGGHMSCLTAQKPVELGFCSACILSPSLLLSTCKGPEGLLISLHWRQLCGRMHGHSALCSAYDAGCSAYAHRPPVACKSLTLGDDLQGLDVWTAEMEEFQNLAAAELRKGPKADQNLVALCHRQADRAQHKLRCQVHGERWRLCLASGRGRGV